LVLLGSRSAALDQNRQDDNKQQAGYHPDDHVRIHCQILSWNVLSAPPERFLDPEPNLQSKLRRASLCIAPAEL